MKKPHFLKNYNPCGNITKIEHDTYTGHVYLNFTVFVLTSLIAFFTRMTILANIFQRKKEKGNLNAYFLHYIINEKHSVKKEMLRSFSFTPSLFSCLVSLLSQLHWLISQFTSLSVISIHKNRDTSNSFPSATNICFFSVPGVRDH